MNPVNQHIIEKHEQHNRQTHPNIAVLIDRVVQPRISAHFSHENRQREQCHEWNGIACNRQFLLNLILQKFGMIHVFFIKQKHKAPTRNRQIQHISTQTCDTEQTHTLSNNIVLRPIFWIDIVFSEKMGISYLQHEIHAVQMSGGRRGESACLRQKSVENRSYRDSNPGRGIQSPEC